MVSTYPLFVKHVVLGESEDTNDAEFSEDNDGLTGAIFAITEYFTILSNKKLGQTVFSTVIPGSGSSDIHSIHIERLRFRYAIDETISFLCSSVHANNDGHGRNLAARSQPVYCG